MASFAVDDTPQDVATNDDGSRYNAVVANLGPNRVYLDFDLDADAGEGVPLEVGDMVIRDVSRHQRISAVCSTGETADVRVIRDSE